MALDGWCVVTDGWPVVREWQYISFVIACSTVCMAWVVCYVITGWYDVGDGWIVVSAAWIGCAGLVDYRVVYGVGCVLDVRRYVVYSGW